MVKMMAYSLLVLLLTAAGYVHCKININIGVSKTKEYSNVEFSGQDIAYLSSQDELNFKVYDESLKDAVKKYFGKRPNDVYLREETPWRLYPGYGWDEVKCVLEPIRARVIDVSTKPVIVATKTLQNMSNRTGIFYTDMYQAVDNTLFTSWSTGGAYTFEREIVTGVTLFGNSSNVMRFTNYWGKTTTESRTTSVIVSSGSALVLEPGEMVNIELVGKLGTMEVEVEYVARLQGDVAVNYGRPYKGHHFWGLDIEAVQEAGNLPKSFKSTATTQINFYSEVSVRHT